MFRRIPRDHVDQTANDRDVVEEYLSARSERAFSELYRRHTPGMYALALRFVAYRTAQADDVVQQAWIRALRQLPAFRWESTLRTWLCAITVNCAREQIRENWWPAAIPDYPSSTPDQVTGLNIDQLIAGLQREIAPPRELEGRIDGALQRQGSIVGRRSTTARRAAVVLVPLLAGFAAGWSAKSAAVTRPDQTVHGSRFIFLLYGGGSDSSGGRVEEYRNWAVRVESAGTDVSGEKLSDDLELLVGAPFDSTQVARLRGFFIVQAGDAERARQLAHTHPHVKGGTIVVRRIDPT